MELNDYQKLAGDTAIYPNKGTTLGIVYCALGLGESGEIQNKVKKILRDCGGVLTDETKEHIKKELGDVLWYCAQMASELGMNLSDVAEANILKLKKRMANGTIRGDGDNR